MRCLWVSFLFLLVLPVFALGDDIDPIPPSDPIELILKPNATVRPVPKTTGTETVSENAGTYRFQYVGIDGTLTYVVAPSNGVLAIDLEYAGKTLQPTYGATLNNSPGVLQSCSLLNQVLSCTFNGGALLVKYRLKDKSLITTFLGTITNLRPGKFRHVGGTVKPIYLPYVNYTPSIYTSVNGSPLFCSNYLDWTFSDMLRFSTDNASPAGSNVNYSASTIGTSSQERLMINCSKDIHETLPHIPNRASSYKAELAQDVIFDSWSDAPFLKREERLRALKGYGLDHLVYVEHNWSFGGYDSQWPTVMPPNIAFGSLTDMQSLVQTSNLFNFRLGLHNDYDPYFADDRTAWPTLAQTALPIEKEVRDVLGVKSAFSDVVFGHPPSTINYSNPPASRRTLWKYLLRLAQKVYEPLFNGLFSGEFNRGALYFAGVVPFGPAEIWDVEEGLGQGNGHTPTAWSGRDAPYLVPDFSIREIHPLMIQEKMGYEWRFLHPQDANTITWDKKNDILPREADMLRAVTVAFGHAAGFALNSNQFISDGEFIKEYYLGQDINKRYQAVGVTADLIHYRNGGSTVLKDLSGAIQSGYDLRDGFVQYYVKWSNGLEIWSNLRAEDWNIVVGSKPLTLPQYGWAAFQRGNTKDFIAYSAKLNGSVVDFIQGDTTTFMDARGSLKALGGIATDGAVAVRVEGSEIVVTQLPPARDHIVSPTVIGINTRKFVADPETQSTWVADQLNIEGQFTQRLGTSAVSGFRYFQTRSSYGSGSGGGAYYKMVYAGLPANGDSIQHTHIEHSWQEGHQYGLSVKVKNDLISSGCRLELVLLEDNQWWMPNNNSFKSVSTAELTAANNWLTFETAPNNLGFHPSPGEKVSAAIRIYGQSARCEVAIDEVSLKDQTTGENFKIWNGSFDTEPNQWTDWNAYYAPHSMREGSLVRGYRLKAIPVNPPPTEPINP